MTCSRFWLGASSQIKGQQLFKGHAACAERGAVVAGWPLHVVDIAAEEVRADLLAAGVGPSGFSFSK